MIETIDFGPVDRRHPKYEGDCWEQKYGKELPLSIKQQNMMQRQEQIQNEIRSMPHN